MPAALQRLWGGAEEFGEDLILDGRDDEEEKDSVRSAALKKEAVRAALRGRRRRARRSARE